MPIKRKQLRKKRLDELVCSLGLAENLDLSRRLIQAGQIRVGGHPMTKPGHLFPEDSAVELFLKKRFVSRGGEKLEGAFEAFEFSVRDKICLDVGSSTGGFTDCLLKHGAASVIAVDVGKGLLDWSLRNDSRVTVMESFNARYLTPGELDVVPQFAVTDVSFISLTLILPAIVTVTAPGSGVISLIKPQFEAKRSQVGHGGVVRDDSVRQEAVERIKLFGTEKLGLHWIDAVRSPITGPKGNVEFLAYWRTPG